MAAMCFSMVVFAWHGELHERCLQLHSHAVPGPWPAWRTSLDARSSKAVVTRFSVKTKGFDAVSISIEEMGMRGGGIAGRSGKIFALPQQCRIVPAFTLCHAL